MGWEVDLFVGQPFVDRKKLLLDHENFGVMGWTADRLVTTGAGIGGVLFVMRGYRGVWALSLSLSLNRPLVWRRSFSHFLYEQSGFEMWIQLR